MFKSLLRLCIYIFRSRHAVFVENIALRHQLQVLKRSQKRPKLKDRDRLLWLLLRRIHGGWRESLLLVQPETVVRWHRNGFRWFWRRKSRGGRRRGRPRLEDDIRRLILKLANENFTWGGPRIHGELQKLGIYIHESTVSKYIKDRKPPSQSWRTFLENHAREIVSVDFCTIPTIGGKILYVFLMIHNASRCIAHFNVTANPTADWTALQILQAFPWDSAPRFLLRDRDQIYGRRFREQLAAMGIEDRVTAYHSPWQNAYAERLVGTVRRECLDHVIVLNEDHLRRTLAEFVEYYNGSRTHLGLGKECPIPRTVEPPESGEIRKRPILGGLHHRYFREVA